MADVQVNVTKSYTLVLTRAEAEEVYHALQKYNEMLIEQGDERHDEMIDRASHVQVVLCDALGAENW